MDPTTSQGILIYYNVGYQDFGILKIVHPTYQEAIDIRGNCPNLCFRYLQLKHSLELVDRFFQLYPEVRNDCEDVEHTLNFIGEEIFNFYMKRFVLKKADGTREYVMAPQEQWFVMKELHELYLKDPKTYRISRELVEDYLNQLPAHRLSFLIKAYKARQQN